MEIGKGRIIKEGNDVAILSFGAHLSEAEQAVQQLERQGVTVTLADARFAKPLDTNLIRQLAHNHEALITIEQGSVGGFGAMVLHHLAATGQLDRGFKIRTMTLPDVYIDQASPSEMYAAAGLTIQDIERTVLNLVRPAHNIVNLSQA